MKILFDQGTPEEVFSASLAQFLLVNASRKVRRAFSQPHDNALHFRYSSPTKYANFPLDNVDTGIRFAMSTKAQQILEDSFALPPLERAAIAEELLASLDRPDPQRDALWAAEAEERLTAYEAGHIKAIPADEVFAEWDQP